MFFSDFATRINHHCYILQAPTLIITTAQLVMGKPGMLGKGTVVRLLSLEMNVVIILNFYT